ncbi:MAG: adenylate/guanylate cyclase domain-containing protein, partial [Marivirga sp.]|nr:adenylate/guanylate cyclase domain-containing protein [Marivirga sp.]
IEKFGLLPEFKAGFHVGMVTTGEIGVIKKEIIFTGDVLNTTSRIQGLCNSYQVNLLISGQLVEKLKPDLSFEFKELGKSDLKGSEERIDLFTIQNMIAH